MGLIDGQNKKNTLAPARMPIMALNGLSRVTFRPKFGQNLSGAESATLVQ